jgi:hypothetical protein
MSPGDPASGRRIALFDLGGTLCDCTERLRDGMSEFEAESRERLEQDLEVRRRLVMGQPGFWCDLPRLPLGFELLEMVQQAGLDVFITTKGPSDAPQVWADKVTWCRRHIPGLPVVVTEDKSVVYGDLLVDDWFPYVEAWQRRWSAGHAVLPAQPWNTDIRESSRLLIYNGCNHERVDAMLRRLVERAAPQ